MNKLFYSWEMYHNLVKQLIKKIDIVPDVIVSIGKGGSIPGVIIAEHFKVDNFNFGLKSYNKQIRDEIVEYQKLDEYYPSFQNQKVLIVDDLTDSGHTLRYTLSRFLNKECKNLKTACVLYKPWAILQPDYYAEKIVSKVWVQQPWETE